MNNVFLLTKVVMNDILFSILFKKYHVRTPWYCTERYRFFLLGTKRISGEEFERETEKV